MVELTHKTPTLISKNHKWKELKYHRTFQQVSTWTCTVTDLFELRLTGWPDQTNERHKSASIYSEEEGGASYVRDSLKHHFPQWTATKEIWNLRTINKYTPLWIPPPRSHQYTHACQTDQVEWSVDFQCLTENEIKYLSSRVNTRWMPGVAQLVTWPILVEPLRWTRKHRHP